MPRLALVLLLASTAFAAPVPKVVPDPLPDGALMRLGELNFRGLRVAGLTFSVDGKLLLTTDGKTKLLRWDAATGRKLPSVELAADGAVGGVVSGDRVFAFTPKKREGVKGQFYAVTVFDLSGKRLKEFETEFPVNSSDPVDKRYRAVGGRWLYPFTRHDRVQVYDTDDGTVVWQQEEEKGDEFVVGMRFSSSLVTPDGQYLFARDGRVKRFPLSGDGKPLDFMAPEVRGFALTPDQKRLVLHRDDKDSNGLTPPQKAKEIVEVWDSAEAKELRSFAVPGRVWAVAADDAGVLIGRTDPDTGDSRLVTRYNLTTKSEEWTARLPWGGSFGNGHAPPVLSPDGKRVLVTDGRGIVALLDAATGERADKVSALDGEVKGIWFSADGKTVYTAADSGARAWETDTGKPLAATTLTGEPQSEFVGTLGGVPVWHRRRLGSEMVGGDRLLGWDVSADKAAWRLSEEFFHDQPDLFGDRLVTAGPSSERDTRPTRVVYDDKRKEVARWVVPKELERYTLSVRVGDALFVHAEGWEGEKAVSFNGRLTLADGKLVRVAVPEGESGQYDRPRAASADGKRVALHGPDGWAVIEAADGKLVAEVAKEKWWTRHQKPRNWNAPVALSPDGTHLLVREDFDSPTMSLIPLANPSKAKTLDGKATAASAVAFSPDGKRAVVGYCDGTALVWDVSK